MATTTDIKNALSFPAESENPIAAVGRTIGNDALLRFQAALNAAYPSLGAADANDAARWLYKQAEAFVLNHENRVRDAANPLEPVPDMDDAP